MITAVDTDILLDILVPNEQFYEGSAAALQEAAGEGSIVVSDIVYAELCIHFETQRECDAFLEGNDIRVQGLTREAHFVAVHRRLVSRPIIGLIAAVIRVPIVIIRYRRVSHQRHA